MSDEVAGSGTVTHMSEAVYQVHQMDGRVVELRVPTDEEILGTLDHGDSIDLIDEEALADLLTQVRFNHPVWWRSPEMCAEWQGGECDCGRISLLEVLRVLDGSDRKQQEAVDAHVQVTQTTWDHFWSGEQLANGGKHINRACVDCLVSGGYHLVDILGEAEELSGELGMAISAFHATVWLGSFRYGDEH